MIFCMHKWKVLSETTTESKQEHLEKMGIKTNKGYGYWLDRKHIQIVACGECGKLKRFVEDV